MEKADKQKSKRLALAKAWWMADPVFARIAKECKRRYGRIWTNS